MTDSQRTLIAVLLDRSGSMESIRTDTEGGFDAFITEQRREPGEATVTLAQFDMTYGADDQGVASAMSATTAYVSRQRRNHAGSAAPGFSPADREASLGRNR